MNRDELELLRMNVVPVLRNFIISSLIIVTTCLTQKENTH